MKQGKLRGFLVKAGALLAAGAIAFSASPSMAQTLPMPDVSGVIITKYDQPAEAGEAADGLPKTPGANTIPGVGFEAYEVPVPTQDGDGNPIVKGSEEWQRAVADITLEEAQTEIGATPDAVRAGVTDEAGVIKWQTGEPGAQGDDLPRGLYLIRETDSPTLADGRAVVPAGDFLLALPLTHPDDLDRWLEDVFVYPKNDTVQGEKTVENATDFAVGDIVTWSINAEIPTIRDHTTGDFIATDKFEIHDILTDDQLTVAIPTDGEAADSVNVAVPAGLVKGTDYRVEIDAGDGTNGAQAGQTLVKVVFEETGRQKLAGALTADPVVESATVTLDTVVESVGVIENEALVFPGGNSSYVIDPTEVRYGDMNVVKKSTVQDADLEGAEFRVYLTEDAANAKSTDEYHPTNNPNGFLTTQVDAQSKAGLWVTDAEGKFTISGLRDSNYADGAVLVAGDARIQTYWLVETKALDGHQLLPEPVEFSINASVDQDLQLEEVTNTANTGGFSLPLTGGTGTAMLTILGLAILALVLFVARMRRNGETA